MKKTPNILQWIPSTWARFVGNRSLIKHFKKMVKRVRKEVRETGRLTDATRLSILVYGPSRSGKTALIKFFIRCLACERFNEESLDPCDGTCGSCKQNPEKGGLEGLWADILAGENRLSIHFIVVDCTKIQSPVELRNSLYQVQSWEEGLRIVYFDECHRLVSRGMDEMLLKDVEEKNCLWIFSTAKPNGLEDMFVNRLLKISSELPTSEELENWLVDRCDEWGIKWETEAILRVVEKSNRVAGTALHYLALAALDPEEGLTLELVEEEEFPSTDIDSDK